MYCGDNGAFDLLLVHFYQSRNAEFNCELFSSFHIWIFCAHDPRCKMDSPFADNRVEYSSNPRFQMTSDRIVKFRVFGKYWGIRLYFVHPTMSCAREIKTPIVYRVTRKPRHRDLAVSSWNFSVMLLVVYLFLVISPCCSAKFMILMMYFFRRICCFIVECAVLFTYKLCINRLPSDKMRELRHRCDNTASYITSDARWQTQVATEDLFAIVDNVFYRRKEITSNRTTLIMF